VGPVTRLLLGLTIAAPAGRGEREVLLLVADGDMVEVPPLVMMHMECPPAAGMSLQVGGRPVEMVEEIEPGVWWARQVRQ